MEEMEAKVVECLDNGFPYFTFGWFILSFFLSIFL